MIQTIDVGQYELFTVLKAVGASTTWLLRGLPHQNYPNSSEDEWRVVLYMNFWPYNEQSYKEQSRGSFAVQLRMSSEMFWRPTRPLNTGGISCLDCIGHIRVALKIFYGGASKANIADKHSFKLVHCYATNLTTDATCHTTPAIRTSSAVSCSWLISPSKMI